jgi:hypothetical protein
VHQHRRRAGLVQVLQPAGRRAVAGVAGSDVERLDSGCCGLAGNFGFTAGHGEVSEACAERVLLPRVRAAGEDVTVLAAGFSCRTQVHELDSGGREAVDLAELAGDDPLAPRPSVPAAAVRAAALVGTALVTAGLPALGLRLLRRRGGTDTTTRRP